jgi:hypothetical protein
VIDLRTLNKHDREALKEEAARRTKAGQSSAEICHALGIKPRRYADWAKQGRFCTCGQLPPASARGVLAHVRKMLEAGDRTEADRMVAAWAAQRRRDKGLSALEAEAAKEQNIDDQNAGLSDDELIAQVSASIGRRVSLCERSEQKS